MRVPRRLSTVPDAVLHRAGLVRGERVLSHARAGEDTWLLGTVRALVIIDDRAVTRLPWEQVENADWDRETERLRVREVGEWGQERPVHTLSLADPGSILELLRERVSASVVLQQRVPVEGKRGFLVIARRSPAGGEISWMHEYDAGIDPDDPLVRLASEQALVQAHRDLGL